MRFNLSTFVSARRTLSLFAVASGLAVAACGAPEGDEEVYEDEEGVGRYEAEDAVSGEAAMSTAAEVREARCGEIRPGRAWTRPEAERFMDLVVKHFADTKRENDRLIRERGVGRYVGFRTDLGKQLDRTRPENRGAAIANMIKNRVTRGNPAEIVKTMRTTSCIGWVLDAFGYAYNELGRGDEWAPIRRCSLAWDSIGTRVQAALVRGGWPSPGIGIVADSKADPSWRQDEIDQHNALIRWGIPKGVFYGAPLSKTVVMKDFLPYPGSPTRKDESLFLQIGKSRFLGIATLRAAYHVPVIIPAASVPDDFVPTNKTRESWLNAKRRGEPFVLESHSLRGASDPTNFEIRPLNEVIGETYGSNNVVYSTGTLIFSPLSDNPVR